MTPLEIEILMHYHCSPVDYRGGDFSAPAVRAAIDAFKGDLGLLVQNRFDQFQRAYALSPRGEAYIKALCEMPLPECVWVIPKDEAKP